MVPRAVGIIGAEHDGRLARFPRDAEREIAFDQPLERLGGVAGGLILVDHHAEARCRGEPLARALVEAADFHFLAREMIVDASPRRATSPRFEPLTTNLKHCLGSSCFRCGVGD